MKDRVPLEPLIKRLKTVAYRLRCAQRGKAWTTRDYDAEIIELEIIPALHKRVKQEQTT